MHHLRFATERLGYELPAGARILDFGCGKGTSVEALVQLGYDAHGIDVADHWNAFDAVPVDVRRRLTAIPGDQTPLPFPDGTFDFCFSDQVFEHLFDYEWAFSGIARVLKPGAISCHRFPGPNRLTEGHVRLPVPMLCYSRAYLAAFALAGRRNPGQEAFSWKQTVEHNEWLMTHNNYPSKRKLRAIANAVGVRVRFFEADEFAFRRNDMSPLVRALMRPFMNRYMVAQTDA